ncbi:MAG: cupin domain-containing protein [Candidatus Binatia bacterium]
MKLHTDLEQALVLQTKDIPWQSSPAPGVERRYLVRDEEKGVVTSIVRYAPGASFPAHSHPGGEEILVLEGTFADEYGQYPAGTYLRNPPGSHHHPYSPDGCVIFVKLGHLGRKAES